MDDIFNMLSSSARIDKSKRKKKPGVARQTPFIKAVVSSHQHHDDEDDDQPSSDDDSTNNNQSSSSKRPKKQHTPQKLEKIHREEIAAFRRRMGIKLSNENRHELGTSGCGGSGGVPDPISSFREWRCPTWWGGDVVKGAGNCGGVGGKEGNVSDLCCVLIVCLCTISSNNVPTTPTTTPNIQKEQ